MTNLEKLDNLTERRQHSDTMRFSDKDAAILAYLEQVRDTTPVYLLAFWLNQEFQGFGE